MENRVGVQLNSLVGGGRGPEDEVVDQTGDGEHERGVDTHYFGERGGDAAEVGEVP